MKMLCGVLIFRLIAAPDVTAFHAETEMHPGIAGFQAFLAAVWGAGFYLLNLIEVCASWCHKVM
jgi:hypothetical protein